MLGAVVRITGGGTMPGSVDVNAFKIASAQAVRTALRQAGSAIIEPLMSLEVTVPEDYLSQVLADLNSRRAQVNGVELKGHLQLVSAQAPLSELFGYATSLRSHSQGRATYTMRFLSYQPVPPQVTRRITGL